MTPSETSLILNVKSVTLRSSNEIHNNNMEKKQRLSDHVVVHNSGAPACVRQRIRAAAHRGRRAAQHARLPAAVSLRLRPGERPSLMFEPGAAVSGPCGSSPSQLCSCSSPAQVRTHSRDVNAAYFDVVFGSLFVCDVKASLRSVVAGRTQRAQAWSDRLRRSLKLSRFLTLAS